MSIWIKTSLGWRPIPSIASNHNNNLGVFRPATPGEARAESLLRAADYERDVQLYISGKLPKEQIFRSFDVPVFGPFGEKL